MANIAHQFLPEVDWENFRPTNEKYNHIKVAALEFARLSFDPKNLKREALAWATKRLGLEEIAYFEAAEDWRFVAIGKYLFAINNGGVFDDDCLLWLDIKIEEVLIIGEKNLRHKAKNESEAPVISIIDPVVRDRRNGYALAQDMEELILTGVYPDDHDAAYDVLGSSSASPTILRNVISKLQEFVDESNNFSQNEIIEGFGSRKNWLDSKKAYIGLLIIAQNFVSNSKTRRKAEHKRKKGGTKAVRTTEAVNFKKEDAGLHIASIDPSSIVGARQLLVYNTNTRKIGLYVAKEDGFQVRGTTIHNYDEKASYQKALRKPEKYINLFRDRTFKRCSIVLRDYIKSKRTTMNGRLNKHIVIMKAWK